MKRRAGIAAAAAGTIALLAGLGQAQPGHRRGQARGRGGFGAASMRLYDPKSVETLSGEVVQILRVSMGRKLGAGLHVVLKTEKEEIEVHLGPAWFLDNQDLKVKKGDRIEVRGSRVTTDGKIALIAARVTRGDDTLILRDEATGTPVWVAWHRRPAPPGPRDPRQ